MSISCPVFNKLTKHEPAIQWKKQHLISGQLQKTRDLDELLTRARDMATWYWSADTWQVSVYHNMHVQYQRSRAYAPTSNTASHDNHKKINWWVSFCFPYMGCLWGYAWWPFGPPELRYYIYCASRDGENYYFEAFLAYLKSKLSIEKSKCKSQINL